MENKTLAQKYFREAFEYHINGNKVLAEQNYKLSIQLNPTSEAYTFLGRLYSSEGFLEKAIEVCLSAIEIDNNYGKAYNDIGSYLVKLGKIDDAIYWFDKAIKTANYEKRYFSYYNLGKVYRKKGLWFTALEMFCNAMEINPNFKPAKNEYYQIVAMMN